MRIVTSPTVTPDSSASSTISDGITYQQWIYTDQQIMAYIMRSISIQIRLSIGRVSTAREQWLALTWMFVQTRAAREYQLHQALQEALQENHSIQDFYNHLFNCKEELQTMEDSRSGQRIETGRKVNGLYQVEQLHLPSSTSMGLRRLFGIND